LCRQVFEASRLNLAGEYSSAMGLARGLRAKICANLCMIVQNGFRLPEEKRAAANKERYLQQNERARLAFVL